ncbi:MAG: SusE domain-containing protein [Paludibacter sp.]|nr:SusE domain-containing protein [Paludibacter sp.]
MKRVKSLYKILAVVVVGLSLYACDSEIQDIPKVEEKLELIASNDSIAIDLDNPREVILTFDWTEAREVSGDNMVFYTTKLDVVGNNFGTSTAIISSEDEGVFSRSFTSEQLYNWMVDRWGVPLTKPLKLEFRVVAQWEGGAVFEAPEVRTITVHVAAVKEEIPVPEKVTLSGSSLNNALLEVEKTIENENRYAALVNLNVGELVIPLVTAGDKQYYLNPKDGEGTLLDGEAEAVEQQGERIAWNITTAGEYRIVVDFENSKVTIYSPAKALEPAVVTWVKNTTPAEEVNTVVTDLYLFGGGTGWGWWKGNCSVSLADPQVLIYQGKALSSGDGVKFVVYGESDFRNLAYTFTNPLTSEGKRQSVTLALDKVGELNGGYDGETRNSYYKLPAGTNFIVFDLRNKTILPKIK